jgi:hypothetical protein
MTPNDYAHLANLALDRKDAKEAWRYVLCVEGMLKREDSKE